MNRRGFLAGLLAAPFAAPAVAATAAPVFTGMDLASGADLVARWQVELDTRGVIVGMKAIDTLEASSFVFDEGALRLV